MSTIEQNLIAFVDNHKQRVEGLQQEIDNLVAEEKYEEAERIKYVKCEVSNTLYRLEKIASGLPAFDEPVNNTVCQKNGD